MSTKSNLAFTGAIIFLFTPSLLFSQQKLIQQILSDSLAFESLPDSGQADVGSSCFVTVNNGEYKKKLLIAKKKATLL